MGNLKPKDLVGIPWRVAFALQADGWYLRSDIIWAKPNPMPESVTDRPTKAHEYLFLLSKSPRYYYDADAVRESYSGPMYDGRDNGAILNGDRADRGKTIGMTNPAGRNLRSVWTIATQPYPGAHFATFPQALVEPCIKAGSPEGGVVLDPFAGSGTTGLVAQRLSRRAVLIDLNGEYLEQVMDRNRDIPLGLGA
jgi:DNA modification methylase